MSNKLHSKLLSVILCIAICCATLCGSIIAVNAAAADFNGTYTISVGDEKNAVPFGSTEVKAQVKFDLPAGFVGGQFTAVAQSTYTIGDTATAVAVTTKDGSEFDPADVEVKTRTSDNNKIFRFVIGDGVLCTSITFEYTISLTGYVQESPSTKFPVSILLSEDDLVQFGTYDLQDVTFTASAESDTFFHAHSAWYDITSLSDVNGGAGGLKNVQLTDAKKYIPINTKDGKHTIASGTCTACEGVNSSASYKKNVQVIPDYAEFDGKTTTKSTTGWCGISGVTVRYNDNGGLDVDVHVYSQYRSGTVDLLICDTEGNELYRLPCVADGTSYFAGNGFPAAEKVFTITGLSATNIETELLLTLAEYGDGTNVWFSRTMPFSLADYCQNVVEENSTIWASGATEAQIEADKDVAAALYYYGAAIDESVFDKNTSAGSDTDYIAANYDEWDGTKVQPTETDDEGNIIIRNAEQLAWVALESGTATAGNNYIVAANSVFNLMGMDGITLNSTVQQVRAVGDAKANAYDYTNAWRTPADNQTNVFQGNFDGNGLIVYNLYTAKGRAYAGLFPFTKPETASTPQVIKNVAVYASHIGGYHYAGGIIGLAECNTTSSIVNFDGCVVKNSYIYDNNDTNSATNRTAGVIVGSMSHNGSTVNNCVAIDNQLSGQGVTGGLIGNKSEYGGSITIKNSLSIGTSVKPTAGAKTVSAKFDSATITNVHTTDVDAATLGSDWFDTETYPELSLFHKLSKQYVDENTHKVICVLKAGDNTCDLKGLTEAHTFTKNAEGTAKVCECGYSVKVYGNIEYIAANYDEWDGTKVQPTETDADGNVIINNAEELAWVVLSGGTSTTNVNYKVKANSVFNMNGMTGITLDSTAEQVKTAAKNSTHLWANDSNYFMGNFDGNGLTVYNINAAVAGSKAYTGLFTVARPENDAKAITIKNVTVAASHFEGYHYTGGIVGFVQNQSANTGCANVDSCAVKNCYFYDTVRAHNSTSGLIIGQINHNSGNVSNCLAINNISDAAKINGGIVGTSSDYISTQKISNCVVIGSLPYSTVVEGSGGKIGTKIEGATVTNVYTDQTSTKTGYTTLTTAQLTGAGAVSGMGLGSVWFDTATYPELSIFHTMTDEYADEITHKGVCIITINGSNCTVCGPTVEHTLTKNSEKNIMECACGYYEDIIGNTVTPNYTNYDEWDGTKVQPTETDADGNVIINNAEELAWIALEGGSATNGVNYKVKANSVFNLMGMAGITINSTVADVQAAAKTWQMRWIQTADSATAHAFGGNFDGNGLTVFNASAGAGGGQGYTGLFPVTRQSADGLTQEIKNVQVVASYFVGYHYAGALIGNANAPGTNNVTNISNIMVKNCYTTDNANTNTACNRTAATVVGNVGHNKTTLNNCIVINTTTVGTNIYGGFIGNSSAYSKGVAITNSVMIGNTTKPVDILDDSKIIEAPAANATLTNVHTADVDAATLGLDWFDTETYPELSIFHDMITVYVDANTHQNVCQHFINGTQCSTTGVSATHTMVDSEDGKFSECECGYSYEIKGIHAMGLPTSILNRITSNKIFAEKFATNALFKAAYNEDVFGTQVQANVFDMYTTSLNLKVNPHIGFMFAFHNDYKTNRSNITVTFTVDGQTYTTEAVETNGTLGTNWVNNSGAGRYHLYRFKELPVSKLCKDVKVTVNYNGAAYDFGTYSAAGYAINAMNAGEDYMQHVNASMSLVYYSEMLAARAGA